MMAAQKEIKASVRKQAITAVKRLGCQPKKGT